MRKLVCVGREDAVKFRKGRLRLLGNASRLGLLESVSRAPPPRGLSRDPSQRSRRGGVFDVTPPMIKTTIDGREEGGRGKPVQGNNITAIGGREVVRKQKTIDNFVNDKSWREDSHRRQGEGVGGREEARKRCEGTSVGWCGGTTSELSADGRGRE
ncbi:hypothetical protein B296_00000150 [Ensete ventricosum]|uniref:Uncharacterized protein n=1 Tax=Ensete ventricosum TaxID=4639 RepID=A0A427B719_ENSVE|nr:hypothetical protein B296_00000150 [Ensete ventricosum]